MTNRQWLMNEMQNMSDEELSKFLDGSTGLCHIIEPDDCCTVDEDCSKCRINWLNAEHKEIPKISNAERVILENVNKEYKWIARDMQGRLYIYNSKPEKTESYWSWTDNLLHFMAYNHLFQFIKWEDIEPYNIEELLKGE